ncbi:hypothetical protein [Rhizobium sp. 3T7]|uniref:hypothetical protein n=1 Tax=Rhizobium sp. 3T7 TaxID=2874922 RepID=UPI0021E2192A|nr:hypothetical protein [Rhizobium sp. 3T7]
MRIQRLEQSVGRELPVRRPQAARPNAAGEELHLVSWSTSQDGKGGSPRMQKFRLGNSAPTAPAIRAAE